MNCTQITYSNGRKLKLENYNEKKDKNLLMIDALKIDISSSTIREKIISNQSHEIYDINHMLDSNVFNYILKSRNKDI